MNGVVRERGGQDPANPPPGAGRHGDRFRRQGLAV